MVGGVNKEIPDSFPANKKVVFITDNHYRELDRDQEGKVKTFRIISFCIRFLLLLKKLPQNLAGEIWFRISQEVAQRLSAGLQSSEGSTGAHRFPSSLT